MHEVGNKLWSVWSAVSGATGTVLQHDMGVGSTFTSTKSITVSAMSHYPLLATIAGHLTYKHKHPCGQSSVHCLVKGSLCEHDDQEPRPVDKAPTAGGSVLRTVLGGGGRLRRAVHRRKGTGPTPSGDLGCVFNGNCCAGVARVLLVVTTSS